MSCDERPLDSNEPSKGVDSNQSTVEKDQGHPPLVDISRQFHVNLKYRVEEVDEKDAYKNTTDKSRKCVQFDDIVKGVEIRSFRDYSESDRRLLWSSFEEIQKNAERNSREFSMDNWDWRKATEEDCMFLERFGGFVHPASISKQKKSQKRKGEKKGSRLHRRKARLY